MQATLAIFRHLASVTPPLVPDALLSTMKRALDYFEAYPTSTLDELEKVMYAYGYELWPYNQAFKEELLSAEQRVGERFLRARLSAELNEHYQRFVKQGGTLRSLRNGKKIGEFFSVDERSALCEILVNVHHDIRAYALQHVWGVGKIHYRNNIEHFRRALKTMHHHIEKLRHLADHEDDHPALAEEIRAQIRAFEQGLCLLGPELSYDAVCSSVDYFEGRQKQMRHFKYLYQPKVVEFFS